MRRILTAVAVIAMLASASSVVWSCGGDDPLVRQALAKDAAVSAKAIAMLREQGPAGVEELVMAIESRRENIDMLAEQNPDRQEYLRGEIKRLGEIIDEVGGAKYCSVSRLYWFTDFEQAKAEAARTNKPILSLRMLGKLNEEFSCANSRFFRTTLYANEKVSAELRSKFVLHWESVRPVPKITIDFGDGRKLERTVTGNSIHYVVDKHGRPLDGLPGMYGPQAFLQWLAQAEKLNAEYSGQPEVEKDAFLREYHTARSSAVRARFEEDLGKMSEDLATNNLQRELARLARRASEHAAVAPPPAAAAGKRARGKNEIEAPIVREVAGRAAATTAEEIDEATWLKIAALHAADAQLDRASVEVIRAENPPSAVDAGRLAVTKARVEDPLARLVRNFQTFIALDTVRNEYLLHRQLHDWFASGEASPEIFALNERVYAELFLTPSNDPWLGLVTRDTYSALHNNGVKVEQQAKQE